MASRVCTIGFPILILTDDGGVALAGVVGFLNVGAYVIAGLGIARVIDRFDRLKVLLSTAAVMLASLLAALVSVDSVFENFVLCGATVVLGAASNIYAGTEVALVREIVSLDLLGRAFAVNQGREAAAMVLAPILGAVLAVANAWLLLPVALVFVCLAAASALALRYWLQLEVAGLEMSKGEASAIGFVSLVRQIPGAVPLLATTAVANFALGGSLFALLLVMKTSNMSSVAIGSCQAAFGIAALAGSLSAGRIVERCSLSVIILATNGFAVFALALASAAGKAVPVAVLVAACGFLSGPSNVGVQGYAAAVCPSRLLGRFMSVGLAASVCLTPLAPLVAGTLLEWFSFGTCLWVFAGVYAVAALVLVSAASVRELPPLAEVRGVVIGGPV